MEEMKLKEMLGPCAGASSAVGSPGLTVTGRCCEIAVRSRWSSPESVPGPLMKRQL